MNRKTTGGPVPDWKLERYLLGELPPGEVEAIRGLTLEDTELQGASRPSSNPAPRYSNATRRPG